MKYFWLKKSAVKSLKAEQAGAFFSSESAEKKRTGRVGLSSLSQRLDRRIPNLRRVISVNSRRPKHSPAFHVQHLVTMLVEHRPDIAHQPTSGRLLMGRTSVVRLQTQACRQGIPVSSI
jgi:hypothetical protein